MYLDLFLKKQFPFLYRKVHKMTFIDTLPSLFQTVKDFGLLKEKAFSKSLGQNFLLDYNITQKIVHLTGSTLTNSHVVEIGPGPGGLTRAIIEKNPKAFHVVEMDPKCIAVMQQLKKGFSPLTIHHQDALTFDIATLEEPVHILSNLPYHIGTELLTRWLHQTPLIQSMTLMFQKEVADRIIAQADTKAYGRLSVISQYCFDIEHAFDLPPSAFTPAPKIYSTVLHFKPKRNIDLSLIPNLEMVTRHAFSMRRKMIRSTLKGLFSVHQLEDLGIKPTLRAEDLTIDDYILLAQLRG
ncbi:MAG: Ribosomal RNA small subunit methyltransferase A [Holosporales bacterium]